MFGFRRNFRNALPSVQRVTFEPPDGWDDEDNDGDDWLDHVGNALMFLAGFGAAVKYAWPIFLSGHLH